MNELRDACGENNGSVILTTISSINVITSQMERLINQMLNINNNIEHKKLVMLEKNFYP